MKLSLKTSLPETEEPVNLTVTGSTTIGDQEIVRRVVPAEDRMQAFLWRHLLPAIDLPAVVYNPSYQTPADRVRPPIRDENRPAKATRNLRKSSAELYLRQIEGIYQMWFFTDAFANRQIASIEARLIK